MVKVRGMERPKTLRVPAIAGALLILAIALSGCAGVTVKAPMDTALKWEPLATKIPLKIGLYESPEFRQYIGETHLQQHTASLPIGDSSSQLINQVLSAMFAEVVPLDHWPPERELALPVGLRPEIRYFADLCCIEPGVHRLQIAYAFTLYCSRLGSERSWTVEAEGLTRPSITLADFTSPYERFAARYASAASTAERNAMAIFMVTFRRETAVLECLAAEAIEAEAGRDDIDQ